MKVKKTTINQKTIDKWKVIRKKWVEALRSQMYKQGDGMLLNYDGEYCCLGVLCIVAGMKPRNKGSDRFFGKEYQFAPFKAMHSVGLNCKDGGFHDNASPASLADMNDQHISFDDIADMIESEPAGLFKESRKW